jgi:hypothetical protein
MFVASQTFWEKFKFLFSLKLAALALVG